MEYIAVISGIVSVVDLRERISFVSADGRCGLGRRRTGQREITGCGVHRPVLHNSSAVRRRLPLLIAEASALVIIGDVSQRTGTAARVTRADSASPSRTGGRCHGRSDVVVVDVVLYSIIAKI